jgi:hypothetical protein
VADITLSLGADDTEVKKGLDKTVKDSEKSGKKAGDGFSNEFSKSSRVGFGKLAAAAVAAGAAIAGALFSRASIAAAQVQEDAINKVNSALFQTGEFSQETSKRIQDFASSLQQSTRFGDEVILTQVAFSKSLGATTEQAIALTKASADLAAATGVDLATANEQLTLTLGGQAGRLARIIPELKNLTEEQLKAGAAIDIIAGKFAGFAERDVETFSGKVDQAKNNFGDLLEQFGFLVTKNVAVTKAIGILSEGFVALGNVVNDNRAAFIELVNSVFSGVVSSSQIVVSSLASVARGFVSLQNLIGESKFDSQIGQLSTELVAIIEQTGRYGDISRATQQVLIEDTQARIDKLKEERDQIQNLGVLRVDAITALEERVIGIGDAIKLSLSGDNESGSIFDTLNQSANAAASSLEGTGGKVNKVTTDIAAANSTLVAGISSSIQFLGKSLVTGENFFKGFIGIALNSFGDLLIGLGTAALSVGTVAEAIKASIVSLAGGSAIVAGVASIAVGGALKAFAGSLGASGASGPTVASDTGTSTGGFISPTADLAQPEPEERRADQSVQIVVQGDILDSEQTGTRILKLITDNFKTSNSALIEGRFA